MSWRFFIVLLVQSIVAAGILMRSTDWKWHRPFGKQQMILPCLRSRFSMMLLCIGTVMQCSEVHL